MAESNSTESKNTNGIPSVMKAAQQSAFGEVREVLTLRDDVPVPRDLSSKQILVRVYAASMNPLDWKILYGNMSLVTRFSFPHVPGKDVAGVVVDIGSDVKRFKAGDKVYGNLGMGDGGFAEYCRADESCFAIKPNNLSMVEASAVPMTGETAYQVLFGKATPPIGAGSKVFIAGGSSSVGTYAIQFAKAVGAHVATTSSKRNFGLLEKLGYKITQTPTETSADPNQLHVIDYNEKDFGQELQGQNYDLVFDCVGGEQQWKSAQQILKHHGQFITLVGDNTNADFSLKGIASFGASVINRKFWSVFGSAHHEYIFSMLNQKYEELDDMRTNYIEPGKVKPVIDTVYDWKKEGVESLYTLYEKSKGGKAQGKLVLKIADEE